MATTTNYSWTTPDDTALVKDGAAAIRSLGTSIDTTTKNLNPSTTLGDIEYRSSTANTNTRLAIGSTGNVLTVSGGVPTWAAPAGGSDNFTLINAGGTSLTSATEITVSGISGKNKLLIYCIGASTTSSYFGMGLRLNADSTANNYTGFGINNSSSAGAQYNQGIGSIGYWDIFYTGTPASSNGNFVATIEGTNTSGIKPIQVASTAGGSSPEPYNFTGYYAGSSAISSITLISSSGNFDAGTVYVYGA